MNRRWQIRAALTVSTMILAATFGRPLAAQTADPDSVAAQIVQTVHDSNLVSPISGAPIAPAALRLVGEAITAPNADTRARMTQALSRSAVSARDIDALLTSLSEVGVAPTQAHVQEVAMDFNSFVNLARAILPPSFSRSTRSCFASRADPRTPPQRLADFVEPRLGRLATSPSALLRLRR